MAAAAAAVGVGAAAAEGVEPGHERSVVLEAAGVKKSNVKFESS